MLLMYYLLKKGGYFPDSTEKATLKLLHAYIDAHSQILIDKYTVYGVKAI